MAVSSSMEKYIQLTPHYNPAYIVLAYFVALIGAVTTVELLIRRSGRAKLFNALLLVGAAVSFGSTATFGMHFVGNQAITLKYPSPFQGISLPLSYDIGFTILSLVISCLSMTVAFSFIGLQLNLEAIDRKPQTMPVIGQIEKVATDEKGGDSDSLPTLFPAKTIQKPEETADIKRLHHLRLPFPTTILSKHRSSFAGTLSKQPLHENGDINVETHDEDTDDEDEEAAAGIGARSLKVSRIAIAKILGAGFICGGGVAAMHYIGQLSINSVPRVTNSGYLVFLSILIAMVAVTTALYLLFIVLRPKLEHKLYKRFGIAVILAMATTLMHFVALLGTHFYVVNGQAPSPPSGTTTSKRVIIAIVAVVAPICCLTLLAIAVIGQRRVLRLIEARHCTIVATALFDPSGLILVQPEDGLLPSAQIHRDLTNERKPSKASPLQLLGFRDRLSLDASKRNITRGDPIFIAYLRSSWSWRSQKNSPLVGVDFKSEEGGPSRGSISVYPHHLQDRAHSEQESSSLDGLDDFTEAATDLAMRLTGTVELRAAGVLYDRILSTGHFQVSSKQSGHKFTITQGKMLLLTRRINFTEREALMARGYTFADPGAVARVTAEAFATPPARVLTLFQDAYNFSKTGVVKQYDRGGLYGGVLVLQAVPGEGLHIIVDEKQHHSVPMIKVASLVETESDRTKMQPTSPLPVATLSNITLALESLDGQTLEQICSDQQPDSRLHGGREGDRAQLQSIIVTILRPYLEHAFSPEMMTFLFPRLYVTASLIQLSEVQPEQFGPKGGLLQEPYLICLKAIVPSSVELPGSIPPAWSPFALYQALNDCVPPIIVQPVTPNANSTSKRTARKKSIGVSADRLSLSSVLSSEDESTGSDSGAPIQIKAEYSDNPSARNSTILSPTVGSGGAATADGGTGVIGDDDTYQNLREVAVPSSYDSEWTANLVRTVVTPNQPWTGMDLPVRHGRTREK